MIRTEAPPAPARLFRAFSDRTRLRILSLLRDGELCVCDLMALLRIPQAKTSRHLGYLRSAGLVSSREQGPWSYYSLAPARDAVHEKLIDCLDACAASLPEIASDRRRARKHREAGGCCPT
jgi:ArsR family transcriptional regulator